MQNIGLPIAATAIQVAAISLGDGTDPNSLWNEWVTWTNRVAAGLEATATHTKLAQAALCGDIGTLASEFAKHLSLSRKAPPHVATKPAAGCHPERHSLRTDGRKASDGGDDDDKPLEMPSTIDATISSNHRRLSRLGSVGSPVDSPASTFESDMDYLDQLPDTVDPAGGIEGRSVPATVVGSSMQQPIDRHSSSQSAALVKYDAAAAEQEVAPKPSEVNLGQIRRAVQKGAKRVTRQASGKHLGKLGALLANQGTNHQRYQGRKVGRLVNGYIRNEEKQDAARVRRAKGMAIDSATLAGNQAWRRTSVIDTMARCINAVKAVTPSSGSVLEDIIAKLQSGTRGEGFVPSYEEGLEELRSPKAIAVRVEFVAESLKYIAQRGLLSIRGGEEHARFRAASARFASQTRGEVNRSKLKADTARSVIYVCLGVIESIVDGAPASGEYGSQFMFEHALKGLRIVAETTTRQALAHAEPSASSLALADKLVAAIPGYLAKHPARTAWATKDGTRDLFLLVPLREPNAVAVRKDLEAQPASVGTFLDRALLARHPNHQLRADGHLLGMGAEGPLRMGEDSVLTHYRRDGSNPAQNRWVVEHQSPASTRLVAIPDLSMATHPGASRRVASHSDIEFVIHPLYYYKSEQ